MLKLCLLTALCSFSAFAGPFSLQFTWTQVSGGGGNSGDGFAFTFTDPSGELEITHLKVTLGTGMIYDLSNLGAGYNSYGPYSQIDGGAGASLPSSPLVEGPGPGENRTLFWTMSTFRDGVTFGYSADVDGPGTCPSSPPVAAALCRAAVDNILPAGFILRGGVDFEFTVAFINGYTSQTFSTLDSCQCWDTDPGVSATTYYDGVLDTPEPATWMLGFGGLVLCALRRRGR